MKTRKKPGLLFILFICSCSLVGAQVKLSTLTTNAGGSSFVNESIQIEWSIGEMAAINTSVRSSIIVSKGVLQPQRFRNYAPTDLLDLKVYPTLTSSDQVQLTGRLANPATFTVRIFNSIGQKTAEIPLAVQSNLVNEKITLPAHYKGALFIEVSGTMEGGTPLKTKIFRIQKL